MLTFHCTYCLKADGTENQKETTLCLAVPASRQVPFVLNGLQVPHLFRNQTQMPELLLYEVPEQL